MKKTLIALALATVAAPTFAAPIDLTHTHEFNFERDVDHQCGVNILSPNGYGKLLVTGENVVDKQQAPRFEIVNNNANYPDGAETDSVEISIESNATVKQHVNGAKYDVFLAENAGFESSQPIVDVEGDKAPQQLQNKLKWGEEYRAQLRLQITDDQKNKLQEGQELKATLKLKIDC